jgi:hypothetical protein
LQERLATSEFGLKLHNSNFVPLTAALGPKADIADAICDVREVPGTDINAAGSPLW